ncbi:hypothetical protein DRJ22_00750 [Candidatus Woesearchaeota archaeon]|nr:MAG: hypothetical protein DRJ22_00750 [Candidatus Woesearchaeota archaeon]
MKVSSVFGVILLVLVLVGIFFGLYFAYSNVGQAVKFAETKGDIIKCFENSDCPEPQKCVDGFCRITPS